MEEPPVLFVYKDVIEHKTRLVSSHRAHATYSVKVTEHIHGVNPIEEDLSLCGLCEALRRQEAIV